MSQYVQRLPNSIGYVEYAYAKQNKMDFVQLKNQAGSFVEPVEGAFKAAAAGADWSKSYYQVLTDEPGKDSWPITGATFILMHKAQDKPAQGTASLKFFDWAYANGDKAAAELDYVPLPDALKAQIRKTWETSIKDAGGKAIAPEVNRPSRQAAAPCTRTAAFSHLSEASWLPHCPPNRHCATRKTRTDRPSAGTTCRGATRCSRSSRTRRPG